VATARGCIRSRKGANRRMPHASRSRLVVCTGFELSVLHGIHWGQRAHLASICASALCWGSSTSSPGEQQSRLARELASTRTFPDKQVD
jgi:hypothetical protein